MNPPFDIVVLCKFEDRNKLPFLIESIEKNINGYSDIYIISDRQLMVRGAICLEESRVVDLKYKECLSYRPGWIYQQFIKLFQDVTKNNRYLVIDADVYINKPLEIFVDGVPRFFLGSIPQRHAPYFKFMREFGVQGNYPHTFISEIMLFDRTLTHSYLKKIGMNVRSFLDKACNIITPDCYISEFEFYGNMVMENYPSYEIKNIITYATAKHAQFSDNEIRAIVSNPELKHFHVLAYHTWKD